VDVAAGTLQTYRVALGRILPRFGNTSVDSVDAQEVAALVADLHAEGLKKQTIRKTVSVLAMVLDHARIEPNPARDRLTVKLPREERRHVEPPTAEHIEAVVRLLPRRYQLPVLPRRYSKPCSRCARETIATRTAAYSRTSRASASEPL
jgi:site-specific recombinase XerC